MAAATALVAGGSLAAGAGISSFVLLEVGGSGEEPAATSRARSRKALRNFESALLLANQLAVERGKIVVGRRRQEFVADLNVHPQYMRVGPVMVMTDAVNIPDEVATQARDRLVLTVRSLDYDTYTAAVMAGMLEQNFTEAIVEDDGTGNGVLALLALRLGARRVVGIDSDREALVDAEAALREAGYQGVVLSRGQWTFYQPQPEDQFILVHEDLTEWLTPGHAEARRRLLEGAPTIRVANFGYTYQVAHEALIWHILREPSQTIQILGGYDYNPMWPGMPEEWQRFRRAGWRVTRVWFVGKEFEQEAMIVSPSSVARQSAPGSADVTQESAVRNPTSLHALAVAPFLSNALDGAASGLLASLAMVPLALALAADEERATIMLESGVPRTLDGRLKLHLDPPPPRRFIGGVRVSDPTDRERRQLNDHRQTMLWALEDVAQSVDVSDGYRQVYAEISRALREGGAPALRVIRGPPPTLLPWRRDARQAILLDHVTNDHLFLHESQLGSPSWLLSVLLQQWVRQHARVEAGMFVIRTSDQTIVHQVSVGHFLPFHHAQAKFDAMDRLLQDLTERVPWRRVRLNGVEFSLDERRTPLLLDSEAALRQLLGEGSGAVVIVAPHPDDEMEMAATIRMIRRSGRPLSLVITVPDETGVTDDYAERYLRARESSPAAIAQRRASAMRWQDLKRRIRRAEARKSARHLGITEKGRFTDLNLDLPIIEVASRRNGSVLSYWSRFKQMTNVERRRVTNYVRRHTDASAFFLPAPFDAHAHHREASKVFLSAIAKHAPNAKVIFYESHHFGEENLKPNAAYFYDAVEQAETGAAWAFHDSQMDRHDYTEESEMKAREGAQAIQELTGQTEGEFAELFVTVQELRLAARLSPPAPLPAIVILGSVLSTGVSSWLILLALGPLVLLGLEGVEIPRPRRSFPPDLAALDALIRSTPDDTVRQTLLLVRPHLRYVSQQTYEWKIGQMALAVNAALERLLRPGERVVILGDAEEGKSRRWTAELAKPSLTKRPTRFVYQNEQGLRALQASGAWVVVVLDDLIGRGDQAGESIQLVGPRLPPGSLVIPAMPYVNVQAEQILQPVAEATGVQLHWLEPSVYELIPTLELLGVDPAVGDLSGMPLYFDHHMPNVLPAWLALVVGLYAHPILEPYRSPEYRDREAQDVERGWVEFFALTSLSSTMLPGDLLGWVAALLALAGWPAVILMTEPAQPALTRQRLAQAIDRVRQRFNARPRAIPGGRLEALDLRAVEQLRAASPAQQIRQLKPLLGIGSWRDHWVAALLEELFPTHPPRSVVLPEVPSLRFLNPRLSYGENAENLTAFHEQREAVGMRMAWDMIEPTLPVSIRRSVDDAVQRTYAILRQPSSIQVLEAQLQEMEEFVNGLEDAAVNHSSAHQLVLLGRARELHQLMFEVEERLDPLHQVGGSSTPESQQTPLPAIAILGSAWLGGWSGVLTALLALAIPVVLAVSASASADAGRAVDGTAEDRDIEGANIELGFVREIGEFAPRWAQAQALMARVVTLSQRAPDGWAALDDLLEQGDAATKAYGLPAPAQDLLALLNQLVERGVLAQQPGQYRLAVPIEVAAVAYEDVGHLFGQLHNALQAYQLARGGAVQRLRRLLRRYAAASEQWPQFPVESRWPVLKAVAWLDRPERELLADFLQSPAQALLRDRPLIDAILLMLRWRPQAGWLRQFAPHLVGRTLYTVASEGWYAAGGLGRVQQYHAAAMKRLVGDEAEVATIEPYYAGVPYTQEDGVLPTPVRGLRLVAEFTVMVRRREVPVEAWRGINDEGVIVYLIRERLEDRRLTKSLYRYGQDGAATWAEFAEFMSRASLALIERMETRKRDEMGEARYTSAAIMAQDGQLGLLPLFKRIQDEERPDNILRDAVIWHTTHTYGNRGWLTEGDLRAMGLDERWWRYLDRFGGKDPTSAGQRTADGTNGVAGTHSVEVTHYDPYNLFGVWPLAVTNGDNLEATRRAWTAAWRSLQALNPAWFPEQDLDDPDAGQMIFVKRESKQQLSRRAIMDGVWLDPDRLVFSYSGRGVPEKVDLERVFTRDNLAAWLAAGAQIVLFINVQAHSDWLFNYLKSLETEFQAQYPGRFVVRRDFTLDDQRALLAATDVQIQVSARRERIGTEAAGATESNVLAVGGLQMSSSYLEGILNRLGVLLNREV
ncbi:MAG: glycogen/starch synthase, partial [Candidatus Omnitrophica bacterium]|nr:glycogen/starch synthase [Candidatus Omnitrophota bacterium]